MLDFDKPVVFSDGEKARIIYTNRKGQTPLIVLKGENEHVVYRDGKGRPTSASLPHLINVKTKKRGFVNIYDHHRMLYHNTKEGAEKHVDTTCQIKAIAVPIEWEE